MAASRRLDREIMTRLDMDVPMDASRSEAIKEAFDMPYVPLNEAYDYGERLAEERGLSYA